MKKRARRPLADLGWGLGVMVCCGLIALGLVLAARTP